MPEGVAAGIALAMALIPATGEARAPSCHVPASLPVPHIEQPENRREIRRMPIGGYTLAMSWTPHQCGSLGGSRRGDMQCDTRISRFGFVLHGLWPDGKGGSWPQWCRAAGIVPRTVLRENLCTTPSVQLMQHEWAKHGSCMAKTADAYFDRARVLFAKVEFPDMRLWAAQRYLTAGDFAGAIARQNPGMRIDMLRIQASRYGMLSEVWLCLDTAFRPTRCPVGKAGLSPNARIRIRSGY
ncbi:MAG: ribonuclease T [Sphingobium sp.]